MPARFSLKRCLMALAAALLVIAPFAAYYHAWAGVALSPDASQGGTLSVVATSQNPASQGTDVWLDIRRSGVSLDPAAVLRTASASEGWAAVDGRLHTDSLQTPLSVACDIPSLYELVFVTTYHSPVVTVSLGGVQLEQDLYTVSLYEKPLFLSGGALVPGAERRAPVAAYLVALLATAAVFIWLHAFRNHSLALLYFWATYALFVATVLLLGQLTLGLGLLLAFGGSSMLLGPRWWHRPVARRLRKGLSLAGMALLVLYTAFALYANPLFLQRVTVTLTWRTLSAFWLLTLVTAPLPIALVVGIDWLRERTLPRAESTLRTPRQAHVTRLVSFAALAVPLLVVAIGFYPVNTTYDGNLYWARALGTAPAGEPFGYLLLLKAIVAIRPDPFLYVVLQIVLFSLAASGILTLLYRRGVQRWLVWVLSLLCALTPPVYMQMTLLSTNPLMAILLLCGLYMLLQLLENPARALRSAAWLIGASLCFLALCFVRRNTAPGLAAFVAVLAVLAWRHRGVLRRRLAAMALVLIACAVGFGVYQHHALDGVTSANEKTIGRLLLKPVIAAQVTGCALPQATLDVIDDVLPVHYQQAAYNPYDSDGVVFSKHTDWQARTLPELARVFVDTLLRYPKAVVKDLLDQTELVWCAFENEFSSNIRYAVSVPQRNAVVRAALAVADGSAANPLVDSLLWRGGLYIVLFLALVLALGAGHAGRLLLAMLPTLAVACFTFPAIGFVHFQYVWFFPLTTGFFLLAALFHAGEPCAAAGEGKP